MEQAGMSMHFFPHNNDPKTYVLMIYADTWDNGTCIRSEGVHRLLIDTEGVGLEDFDEKALVVFAQEIGIQSISADVKIEDLTRVREIFARAFRASATPSQEM